MSGTLALLPPHRTGVEPVRVAPPVPVEFHYTQTDSFVALLQQLGASLLVSNLLGQQTARRPGRRERAVHVDAHVRAAHGPSGGRAAADHWHPQPGLVLS